MKATPLKAVALHDGESTELVETVLPIPFNRLRFCSELFRKCLPLPRKPQHQSPHGFPPPTNEGPVSFHRGNEVNVVFLGLNPMPPLQEICIVGIAMKPDLTPSISLSKVSLHLRAPPPMFNTALVYL